jgi:hypothetical protein
MSKKNGKTSRSQLIEKMSEQKKVKNKSHFYGK